jgi:hypothetical protein
MSVVFTGIPVSSTSKPDRHDIAEILLKVAFNTITSILTLAILRLKGGIKVIKQVYFL